MPNAVNNLKHWHMPIQIVLFWYAKSNLFIPQWFRDKLRLRTTLQTPTHNYIYSPTTHTHITHTHTNTTRHTKRLLTRTKTSPIDKPNHWHTPTNGTIRTCTTILSLSPWFKERLNEYTTWQTPTHNLRHCHTSHKTGFQWSISGILLCGSWRRLWKSECTIMYSYSLLSEP